MKSTWGHQGDRVKIWTASRQLPFCLRVIFKTCMRPTLGWKQLDLYNEGSKRVAPNFSFSGLVASCHNSKCGGSYSIYHVGALCYFFNSLDIGV